MSAPRLTSAVTAALLLVSATACSSTEQPKAATGGTLRVAASPVPHAESLNYVAKELAPKEGLKIEVVEFTDYVQPNEALKDGSVDANYFQHQPYLDEQSKAAGYRFTSLGPVHLEPLGLYSKKVKAANELREGAVVAIPNDPSNGSRALHLLADQKLITLKDPDATSATPLDIKDNPKKLSFKEVEAAQSARSLDDADAAVINGNYALSSGLKPAQDALVLEKADGNPYANLLVVREGDKDNPGLKKLAQLLKSDAVKKFIESKYDGSVVAS